MSQSVHRAERPAGALPEGPSWLTPRRVAVGCLALGALAISAARADAVPGISATAAMVIAAWAPMALTPRWRWVRRLTWAWAITVTLALVYWWLMGSILPALPPGVPRTLQMKDGYSLLPVVHWPWKSARGFAFLGVALWPVVAMAALFASVGGVWRAFRRERSSPARDSADHLAVIAGAWLALAGSVGALDALNRPEGILLLDGQNRRGCSADDAHPCAHDDECVSRACAAGRCARIAPARKEPPCQAGPSRVAAGLERRCEFCRDLTSPPLRLAGGTLAVAIALAGAGVAIAAARRLRRRARWIEQVGDGSAAGWSLAYCTPAWGSLAAVPRLVGGDAPSNLTTTCLIVREPPGSEHGDAGFRAQQARGAVLGRLDTAPWMGVLDEARRGEAEARGMMRTFALACLVLTPGTCVACVFRGFWVDSGLLSWLAEGAADALLVGLPFVVLLTRQVRRRPRPTPKPGAPPPSP